MNNSKVITHLYRSLQKRDHEAMAACYHPEASFRDEVFDLKGKQVAAMWHMLCERGRDLELDYYDIRADGHTGSAHLKAVYTFSQTGRIVHNSIEASFRFKSGMIIEHRDRFSFWRWSGKALGITGRLLGWSSFLQRKVSAKAHKALDAFIDRHPVYR